jgi:hypothetical protein
VASVLTGLPSLPLSKNNSAAMWAGRSMSLRDSGRAALRYPPTPPVSGLDMVNAG